MLNGKIDELAINKTSTYESDKNGIDYIFHLRNATAHGNFTFSSIEGRSCVTYYDKRKENEEAIFSLYTFDVGEILTDIQKLILSYFEKTYNP